MLENLLPHRDTQIQLGICGIQVEGANAAIGANTKGVATATDPTDLGVSSCWRDSKAGQLEFSGLEAVHCNRIILL